MNYYTEIKQKLIDNEIYGKVKDYSKERNRVITYYEIGKLLLEAGSVYGEDIIGNYSKKLMKEIGKKYDKTTLLKMRQLYIVLSNEKVAPLVRQLSWSYYCELLYMKDLHKVEYYINIVVEQNLFVRQFYNLFSNEKVSAMPTQLTWSHYIALI